MIKDKLEKRYFLPARERFKEVTNVDAFIIAYALRNPQSIMVTLEKNTVDNRRIVKIPEICKHFNIEYINMIDFLKEILFIL